MSKQRIGRFSLPADIVYSDDAVEIFKQLELIPLRAELMSYSNLFSYVAVSPRFDAVEEGLLIPEYNIAISSMETDKGRIIQFRCDFHVARLIFYDVALLLDGTRWLDRCKLRFVFQKHVRPGVESRIGDKTKYRVDRSHPELMSYERAWQRISV